MGIGDEIMVTGQARRLQQHDRRRVKVMYDGRPGWHEVFAGNPRIARPGDKGSFQPLVARQAGLRPYHSAKAKTHWTYNLAYRPDAGELYLTPAERAFGDRYADRVVVEPHIKPLASPNKQWGWGRFVELSRLLLAAGLPVAQLGAPGLEALPGVERIETPDFRHAAAVIGRARVCVLPEGGSHHAAAALGAPAVVIFGGFTPVELTGYPGHRNLGASLDQACGMRVPCDHCKKWMARITPEQVADEARRLLAPREVAQCR